MGIRSTALAACFFHDTHADTQKQTTKDCFFLLYDGNNICVVFIGAQLECERAWEDDHLKIIIVVLENYVRANAPSSFKEDDEEEHDENDQNQSGDDATRTTTRIHARFKTPGQEREIRRRVRRKIRPGNAHSSPSQFGTRVRKAENGSRVYRRVRPSLERLRRESEPIILRGTLIREVRETGRIYAAYLFQKGRFEPHGCA